MKIAFVGKGGSGKTTLSSLVSRYLASQKLPVLAIDSDINQHLAQALGMPDTVTQELQPLGIQIHRIKDYLRGNNPLIADTASMIKTTPPGYGSRLLTLTEQNPIYEYFAIDVHGVKLMAVGPFEESDLGTKCYHSKTGSVELLLNHLVEKDHEYVIVDMTDGADSFASGLFTRFDITFLVVEPTLKSVGVYQQYKEYAKDHAVVIKVIGNKVESDTDMQFLRNHVGDDLVTAIQHSEYVRRADRGELLPLSSIEPENLASVKYIANHINSQKKDWAKFYRQAVEFHQKNALSWANNATGKDLRTQIDKNFSYPGTE